MVMAESGRIIPFGWGGVLRWFWLLAIACLIVAALGYVAGLTRLALQTADACWFLLVLGLGCFAISAFCRVRANQSTSQNRVSAPIDRRDLYAVVFIGLLSLLVLVWYGGDFMVNPSDTFFSFFPPQDLVRSWYIRDHFNGLGQPDALGTTKTFPNILFLYGLQAMGMNIYHAQKTLYWVTFFFCGINAYVLMRWLLQKEGYAKRLIAVGCANFYMINGYVLCLRWGGDYINATFLYMATPLMIYAWLKGVEQKRLTYALLVPLACLLGMRSLNNPTYILCFFIFVLVYTLCYLTYGPGKFISRAAYYTKFIAVNLLGFLVVFAPLLFAIYIDLQFQLEQLVWSSPIINSYTINMITTNFFNLFRQLAFWGFWAHGTGYYPYAHLYDTPILIFIGIGLAALALVALVGYLSKFNSSNNNFPARMVLIFSIIYILAIFLSKGGHPPLGGVYAALISKGTFFNVVRSSLDKFGEATIVAQMVLLGYALSYLATKIKGKNKAGVVIVVASFILAINIFGFPFWTGQVWRKETSKMAGRRFIIPEDYNKLMPNNNLKIQGRILMLPTYYTSGPGILALKLGSGKYLGSDPLFSLSASPIIYINNHNYGAGHSLLDISFDILRKRFVWVDIYKHNLMGLFNSNYWMIRKDLLPNFFNRENNISHTFGQIEAIPLINTRSFTVYRNLPPQKTEMVYLVSREDL
jgi:hypothetical protein